MNQKEPMDKAAKEPEEVRKAKDFATLEEFLQYANLYSIFDEDKLKEWYTTYNMVVIKMTYNAAFDNNHGILHIIWLLLK